MKRDVFQDQPMNVGEAHPGAWQWPFVDFLRTQSVPLATTVAVLLAIVEVLIDWSTWVQLDVSAVSGLPLVIAAAGRSRRGLWLLAVGLILSTFAVYAQQIAPGGFSVPEPFFITRMLNATPVAS